MTQRPLGKLLVAFLGRCYYCRLTVDTGVCPPHPRAATRDHMYPLSRGGKNTQGNCVLACYRCNHEKGDMTEVEFRAFRRHKMLGKPKCEALRLARFPNSAQDFDPQ